VRIDNPAAQAGAGAVIQGPQGVVVSGNPLAGLRGNATSAASGGSKLQGPLADMLVELARDGEVLRTMTDAQGVFVFDGLRPGYYHLRVYADNLPEHHHIEKPEQDLDLAANAEVTLDMRVLPESRRIKMIDGGTIPSVASTPSPAAGG
jgi:hypothetical protein